MSAELSRRSVAKGAAWSVPAVAVGAPAAQAATSGVTISAAFCQNDATCRGQSKPMLVDARTANGANAYLYRAFKAETALPVGTSVCWTVSMPFLTSDDSFYPTPSKTADTMTTYGTYTVSAATTGAVTYNGESFTLHTHTVCYNVTTEVPAGSTICVGTYWGDEKYIFRSGHAYPGATVGPLNSATASIAGANGGFSTDPLPAVSASTSTRYCY